MSLSPVDITGSLAFDPDEVDQIQKGNLLPEGQRILKVVEATLEEEVGTVGGINFGAGDGLMKATVTLQADPEWDPDGNGRQVTENLRFLHANIDDSAQGADNIKTMSSISRRTILSIVKAAQIEVPFNDEGKMDFGLAWKENLRGARLMAKCKHVTGKKGGVFANLGGWKPFNE